MRFYRLLFAIIVFAIAPISIGHAQTALLLSDDDSLLAAVEAKLPDGVELLTHQITTNADKGVITTDEGQTIRFSTLFHSRSLKGSQERERLYTEYGPDYLILAWITEEGKDKYANYGVSKSKLKATVRIVDGKTGAHVLLKKLSHSTELALDSSDNSDAARGELIDATLTQLTADLIDQKIAKYQEKKKAVYARVKVIFKNLDQAAYFESQGALIRVAEQAAMSDRVRDTYSRSANELVLRVQTQHDVDSFYRLLYASAVSSSAIDAFEIDQAGTDIVITLLPPEPKTVSLKALSPVDYRNAGREFVEMVSAIDGVNSVEQTYSETDQTLTLTFTLKGHKLYAVDKAIWDQIKENDHFKGLALGELDNNELEYFFSGGAGKSADLIVHMRHVRGQDYKQVATEFADILGKTKGVRNLRYSYAFDKKTIIFRLRYEGEGLFALDDALQRMMLQRETFKYVAKGPERLGRLIYIYNTSEESAAQAEEEIAESLTQSNVVTSKLGQLDNTVVYLYVEFEAGEVEGSGFIVSERGHILTNAHIIEGGYVYVRTYDGTQYRAETIKTDRELDLGLVRIVSAPKKFPAVTIGNSDDAKRGDQITVIGNPLGARFEHSILTGIISGSNREKGLLQLSIPTYGGLSGSPVFDSRGKVIAIMRSLPAFLTTQEIIVKKELVEFGAVAKAHNIGLAVPINYARTILDLARP